MGGRGKGEERGQTFEEERRGKGVQLIVFVFMGEGGGLVRYQKR